MQLHSSACIAREIKKKKDNKCFINGDFHKIHDLFSILQIWVALSQKKKRHCGEKEQFLPILASQKIVYW